MQKLNRILAFSIFLYTALVTQELVAQSIVPKEVQSLIEKAFQNPTQSSRIAFIESGIENLKTTEQKLSALIILADYEERCDLHAEALQHYLRASEFKSITNKKQILLKALGVSILATNFEKAFELSQNLQSLIQTPISDDDVKVLVHKNWIQLSLYEESSQEFATAIAEIKKRVTDLKFEKFHPALLLTLWWIEDDKKAENTLLKKFPNSIEANVVIGKIILSPKTFWYLLPRNISLLSRKNDESDTLPNRIETKTTQALTSSEIKFYQIGFFKTEDYAKALKIELAKKSFSSLIKKEKRSAGTFFSVLVNADKNSDVLLKLKQAGYDPVPVFK